MLSLRHLTQSVLLPDVLAGLLPLRLSSSWPVLCAAGAILLLAPSWLARTGRRRGWPECSDGHFKEA
jgi:hypothetical protein